MAIQIVHNYCSSVLDVRPHLRFNVGIKSGKDMLSILTAGSRLPTKKSKECTCTGVDSVELQIYQGDRRLVSHNRRVHSIELELQSEELKKPFTVTLDVAKDGTLTTIGKEQGYRNTNATVAPRIIGKRFVLGYHIIFQCLYYIIHLLYFTHQ